MFLRMIVHDAIFSNLSLVYEYFWHAIIAAIFSIFSLVCEYVWHVIIAFACMTLKYLQILMKPTLMMKLVIKN